MVTSFELISCFVAFWITVKGLPEQESMKKSQVLLVKAFLVFQSKSSSPLCTFSAVLPNNLSSTLITVEIETSDLIVPTVALCK